MTFIVDVGTSWNALRTIPLRDRFDLPVLFIEPDSEALAQIPANQNDIKLNAAITSYTGVAEFLFYQDGTHSLLKTNLEEIHKFIDGNTGTFATREEWTPRRSIEVPCFRLETVLSSYSIDSVAFLKIDAQGHDLEVLRSLGDKIRTVQIFEVEVQVTDFEIYRGQSKQAEVLEFAEASNFDLVGVYPQTFNQEFILIFVNRDHSEGPASALAPLILQALDESLESEGGGAPSGLRRQMASTIDRFCRKLAKVRDAFRDPRNGASD